MIITLFYEIALFFLALLALPKFLYQWLFHNKYQKSFKNRLGGGFPPIDKHGTRVIWIHAVSVGETLAVTALAKRIKEEYPDSILIVSTTSETGQAEARRSLAFANHFVYLPFDFGFIIKPILKKANPDLLILCESDFWLNFMQAAKKQDAQIALVNGKLSAASAKRFGWVSPFSKRLFSLIDHLFIQSSDYDKRFAELGIAKEKRTITGNMKFDVAHPALSLEEKNDLKTKLGLKEGDRLLVVGSCHDSEEQLVLDALEPLWGQFPSLKIIFVPRHPERFATVYQLLQRQKYPSGRFSEAPLDPQTKLILIDAMGLLRKCYQLADLALVAGSYTPKVGGHNITEPCWYGVPVIYGPFMHTQKELVTLMKSYQAGLQIPPEALTETIQRLLTSFAERQKLGENGLKLVSEANGATEKTWQGIKKMLSGKIVQKPLA